MNNRQQFRISEMKLINKIYLLFVIMFLVVETGYSKEKLKIVVSNYPLQFFAEHLGGNQVSVSNIVPFGVDLHEYRPSPREMGSVWKADIFLYHGFGEEPWAERIIDDLHKKGILTLKIEDIFKGLLKNNRELLKYDKNDRIVLNDPHLWLDPLLSMEIVKGLATLLQKADSSNNNFNINLQKLSNDLAGLHEYYNKGLRSCKSRIIITTHNAFEFLARRYNLKSYSILGISGEDTPSPRKIIRLIKLIKSNKIPIIFYETQTSYIILTNSKEKPYLKINIAG